MSLYPIQPSFAGGELSPSLWGRVDLNKYATGLRRLENFVVHPHGGVSRRPGMRFVAEAKGKCRLVAFQYNAEQNYILEFGNKYVRFFKDGQPVMKGAVPYEVVTPYAAAELNALKFTQSADVLFICHGGHAPMELARYADTNWKLSGFRFKNGPFRVRQEGQEKISIDVSGLSDSIEMTADTPLFVPGHAGCLWAITQQVPERQIRYSQPTALNAVNLTGTRMHEVYGTGTVVHKYRSGGDDYEELVSIKYYNSYLLLSSSSAAGIKIGTSVKVPGKINPWAPDGILGSVTDLVTAGDQVKVYLSPWQGLTCGANETPESSAVSVDFYIDNTADVWSKEILVYKSWRFETNGFWYGTLLLQRYDEDEQAWLTVKTYSSPHSARSAKNFADSGEFDEPTRLRVYSTSFTPFVPKDNEETDKGYVLLIANACTHRGLIKSTGYVNSKKMSAKVLRRLYSTSATRNWEEGAWSAASGWPQVCGFYQERMVFGATFAEPQTVWMSKTGDYYDFGTSSPVVDDDGVSLTLAARQVNAVKAFVTLSDLLLLTSGSEWKISAGAKTDAVTPTSVSVSAQGYRGISEIEPVVIGNTVLFVQGRGSRVRDLGYTFENDAYTGSNLTVMASHLFEGHKIVDLAYQQEPDSVCWVARDDGALLALTYLREHDVIAWGRHPTDGKVESVAVVPSPGGDVVHLCVLRRGKRCIETMTPASVTEAVEAFFVDSGVTVRGSNVTSVTGLERLNGCTVTIVADGSLRNPQVVANGRVTVSPAASVVHVGLPYVSKLETLDLNFARGDGAQLTRKVRLASATIRVENTRHLFAGTDEKHLREYVDRTNESYNSPTRLSTGDWRVTLDSRYDSGRLVVVAPGAMPASIVAIVPEADPGD